jgi:hypothetical protein
MGNDDLFDLSKLEEMNSNPVTQQIDDTFKKVIKEKTQIISKEDLKNFKEAQEPDLNSDGEIEIGLDEKQISLSTESSTTPSQPEEVLEEGFELDLNESSVLDLSSGDKSQISSPGVEDLFGDLDMPIEDSGNEPSSSLSELPQKVEIKEELVLEDLDFSSMTEEPENKDRTDLLNLDDLSADHEIPDLGETDELNDNILDSVEFDPEKVEDTKDQGLYLNVQDEGDREEDLSDDARKKLEEIDEILVEDATRIKQQYQERGKDKLVDEEIFSLNEIEANLEKDKSLTKTKNEVHNSNKFKDVSNAYTGEIERIQATLSNLRSDREELLLKIQNLEEEKILHARQILSQRAELDERKIELTIIRKKLHEEINNLKDANILQEERKLILEEKNRVLQLELDKAKLKNKIDVKHVQMREKELEQKLELLKSDAETQIRNRDLKILELKRKIDAMEFDMESISSKEKKSIESRYELEDRLDKAIKTLKSAISVLEEEGNHNDAMSILKKNIDL